MSSRDVPPPDVLVGDATPFSGFGEVIQDEAAIGNFRVVVDQARHRLREGFDIQAAPGRSAVAAVERTITEMWDEGWDPDLGDVNLFARDFGALVMASLVAELGATQVFRSTTDLTHASVYWPDVRLEAFPFHKTFKRLTNREGDSLLFFFDALQKRQRKT